MRAVRRLFGTRPTPGSVKVLVTHGVVVSDATGLKLEEGETLVLRPLDPSRFRLLGRILSREWRILAAAVTLVHLYAERGSPKFEKAAMRWLERYLIESSPRLQHLRNSSATSEKLEPRDHSAREQPPDRGAGIRRRAG
jgi:hypothetical protein